MAIDIGQFFDDFFEECMEALEIMEAGLLDSSTLSSEGINEVFRAAHSIKGGAATIGLTAVSDFTHNAETLLDAVRKGSCALDGPTANLLLASCDCIRDLLAAERSGEAADIAKLNAVTAQLMQAVGGAATSVGSPQGEQTSSGAQEAAQRRLHIDFRPHANMLAFGNDPLAIFDGLRELGTLTAKAYSEALPTLEELDPEHCYLYWHLGLEGAVSDEALADIFDWISDSCDISIEELPATAVDTGTTADPGRTAAAAEGRPEAAPNGLNGASAPGGNEARSNNKVGSIRVNTDKIDQIINMVGELVITQAMLKQVGEELGETKQVDSLLTERLADGLGQLERHTRELQQSAMGIRMVLVSFAFNRFPRLVHDLSAQLGKKIRLVIHGENTEIDKTLVERIGDPLVHLLRNAIDHGIEFPEERIAAGKDPTGTITLEASHRSGNVVIEVSDDGRGIDAATLLQKAQQRGLVDEQRILNEKQALDLIFEPGFSTAEQVSDLSGRGVGMDVVRSNVKDLGGDIELKSVVGEGTHFTINLPLTLAILDGQTIRVGSDIFIIAMASILESLQVPCEKIRRINSTTEVFRWREEQLPLIRLDRVLGIAVDHSVDDRNLVVVVEAAGQRAGLAVSDLLSQQQVVIKSLDENFRRVDGFSGATILGDGSVALILDITGIIALAGRVAAFTQHQHAAAAEQRQLSASVERLPGRPAEATLRHKDHV